LEGGVHAHTRKALKAGCTPDEIKHTVMLALPTLGLPSTMAAFSWVEDIINNPK
jgi:alkylhydroperoxidase/carboxymuconolactone decarboxylase family protein YurZ